MALFSDVLVGSKKVSHPEMKLFSAGNNISVYLKKKKNIIR
jgi:hypothetical protein